MEGNLCPAKKVGVVVSQAEVKEQRAEKGAALLAKVWDEVQALDLAKQTPGHLSTEIQTILNGSEKGWRYSLLIQTLGKATDFKLNALSLQGKDTKRGSWDAREFGKAVVVPWESSIGDPLGGSKDPYVGNQFRLPRFGPEMERDRKSPELYKLAFAVASAAQKSKNQADAIGILRQVLIELRRWLLNKSPAYATPQRVSKDTLHKAISAFLDERSGGERLQAVVYGVFRALRVRGLYSVIKSAHVNAADAASGRSGDVECLRADGTLSLTVEAKDRPITPDLIDDSIKKARVAGVVELLVLVNASPEVNDTHQAEVKARIEKEFSSGLNVYVKSPQAFFDACFVQLGETGRRDVLHEIGEALAEVRADYKHRLKWADIVRSM
jgi:hypothetical protein